MRGRDAAVLRGLADQRRLGGADVRRLGSDARESLAAWLADGWAHPADPDRGEDTP